MKIGALVICSVVFFFFGLQGVSAVTLITDLNIDTATIARGYSVSSSDKNFNLIVLPGVLNQESRVLVKQIETTDVIFPENWEPVSEIYEYEVVTASALGENKALVVNFGLQEAQKNQKRIFAWDVEKEIWSELKTEVKDAKNLRVSLFVPAARLVVLEKPIMELGQASWYKYKNCDCAASPDYPKGTKLRVKNLANGKEVVVTVNDFGPVRALFPDRVIDLDKVAFKKIGALSRGILKNILVTLENK